VKTTPVAPITTVEESENVLYRDDLIGGSIKLKNSDVLANLQQKLSHLPMQEQKQMSPLILKFADLCPDVLGETDLVYHDVDVMGTKPIKQHPYCINPVKLQFLRKEVEYMLVHDIIEPSESAWSSPCLLVPKGDRTYHFCMDFHKVNSVTKLDSYSITRVEDCMDYIGCLKYVTKFDLLKGYW